MKAIQLSTANMFQLCQWNEFQARKISSTCFLFCQRFCWKHSWKSWINVWKQIEWLLEVSNRVLKHDAFGSCWYGTRLWWLGCFPFSPHVDLDLLCDCFPQPSSGEIYRTIVPLGSTILSRASIFPGPYNNNFSRAIFDSQVCLRARTRLAPVSPVAGTTISLHTTFYWILHLWQEGYEIDMCHDMPKLLDLNSRSAPLPISATCGSKPNQTCMQTQLHKLLNLVRICTRLF